jgi:hypothetical protein
MTQLSDNINKLRLLGKSYKEIQDELNCSKGTISYYLGAGQKEKNIQRTRDKRNKIRKYIQEYKQSHPCVDCGENYPYWIMDFDHLKDKQFNISNFQTKFSTIEIIKKEINKCDVVCSNCHRNRTYLRLIESGSDTMNLSSHYE